MVPKLLEGAFFDPLASPSAEVSRLKPHSFHLVLVFPLPAVVKDLAKANEGAFRKAHPEVWECESPYNAILNGCILAGNGLELTARCHENLESLRCATIEVYRNFLEELGISSKRRDQDMLLFTSRDVDELFCCLRLTPELAEQFAEEGEYQMQLKLEALEELKIKLTKDRDRIVPAYVKYRESSSHLMHNFRGVDMTRLLYDKITDYLNLDETCRYGLVSAFFPCHHKSELEGLADWAHVYRVWHLQQPIEEVRNYFGEGIAFYFLFIETICRALRWLLIFAVFCGIIEFVFGQEDIAKLLFVPVLLVWFSVLVKLWERCESYFANRWGTDAMEYEGGSIKDPTNPHFKGKLQPSPIDEYQLDFIADRSKRARGVIISFCFSLFYLSLVILGVAINRRMALKYHSKTAYRLAAVGLSIQIKIFDLIWGQVGGWLTRLEEHVLLSRYEQSLALKTFVMKFINTFNSFVWTAFFQEWLSPESCQLAGSCQILLRENLVIVFATYISFGFVNMATPYLWLKVWTKMEELSMTWEARKRGTTLKPTEMSFLEQQAKMRVYGGDECSADYLQVIFPLSFIALFGMVMPSIVVLAFLALSCQLRTDAWKLCYVYRRPFPTRASGIGVWKSILKVLCYMAIFTNAGLLLTQVKSLTTIFPFLADSDPLMVFFMLQNVLILIRISFDNLVNRVSGRTRLEIRRQILQRSRALEAQQNRRERESLKVEVTGNVMECAFHEVRGLEKGHPFFEAPYL